MSDGTFKFTELHLGIPLDNLTAAISIIQTQIMAAGSDIKTEVMFGLYHFPTEQMQTAISLLVPLIGPVEALRWNATTLTDGYGNPIPEEADHG